jgi:hypothetical protein
LVSDIKGVTWTEMFENRILRRISGSKRYQIIEGWRNMHNEEFRNFCPSPNKDQIYGNEKFRTCSTHGGKTFVGMSEGKRPLGGPTCK